MCVENQNVGYYESGEDFLMDPDFIAWCERSGRRPTNSWPAYIQALADARELIELAPSDVAALAGQNQLAAVGGGDLTATGARSTSDLMAPERVHECCRILGCKPIALVERVRELAARKDPDVLAIAQAVYNSDDAVTVAGIASVIAAEIG